ncbi:nucleoside triphosphate pyrophosphohydrolase [Salinarimonas soli]|uniref:Nucleoside triphosphate pyrophosphohydrolase n=1 Tax=Salinarimonas soli TaxID=1638099 RepID=A0A5B2VG72_9HYPH|nr:nucleoside triphosphate pyrophosphohydrolase [Salinarimonas soli]KAA2237628.1 nucleoside triphosphate pyrophosphohydrolase [Salinarimonas soli]
MIPSRDIAGLVEIMARLRDPERGCAWDVAQDFRSIVPYTLEEAYEVADAVERGDLPDLRDELGDLLLQVVFHARMAEEEGAFAFPDVVEAITSKLIRRHPHVFGEGATRDPAAIKRMWGEIKAQEKAERRAARGGVDESPGLLAGVPGALPALTRAEKLTTRAATVGFDWPDAGQVIAKIREETAEIEEALAGGDKPAIQDEIGDLLFAVANLARHCGVDPEAALRGTNAKFERRFRHIETALEREGRTTAQAGLGEMERLWGEAKDRERGIS